MGWVIGVVGDGDDFEGVGYGIFLWIVVLGVVFWSKGCINGEMCVFWVVVVGFWFWFVSYVIVLLFDCCLGNSLV